MNTYKTMTANSLLPDETGPLTWFTYISPDTANRSKSFEGYSMCATFPETDSYMNAWDWFAGHYEEISAEMLDKGYGEKTWLFRCSNTGVIARCYKRDGCMRVSLPTVLEDGKSMSHTEEVTLCNRLTLFLREASVRAWVISRLEDLELHHAAYFHRAERALRKSAVTFFEHLEHSSRSKYRAVYLSESVCNYNFAQGMVEALARDLTSHRPVSGFPSFPKNNLRRLIERQVAKALISKACQPYNGAASVSVANKHCAFVDLAQRLSKLDGVDNIHALSILRHNEQWMLVALVDWLQKETVDWRAA
mgnify:CR=1 FL=1